MAGLGRSNSLSINTGGGSLFGNNAASKPQQSAGLFGGGAQQPAAAGGLFGSSTSQPQTGGLFGGAAPAAQPPQTQTSSLFGGQTQQPAQPQATGTTGGLFGSSTASAQQPQQQQSGGLFGGALGGNAQQSQAAPQSGGLFNLGQSAAKPAGGLFGAATQQTSAPSLFGGNTNTQQPAAPSLFGAAQQTQPQQNSLFGGMNNQPGAAATQSTNRSGLQVAQVESIKGHTRFTDLHPDLQGAVTEFDNSFQHHISNARQIREILPQQGVKVASISPDVTYIEQLLATVELGLDNDSANVSHTKKLTQTDTNHLELAIRAVENQRLPEQFRYGNRSVPATNLSASNATKAAPSADDNDDSAKPVDLVGYFSNRTDDLASTLGVYQRQIREIEAHLRTMEIGAREKTHQLQGNRGGAQDQRRELIEALRAIEGAVLESAKNVGQTRDLVTQQTLGSAGTALL